MNQSQPPTDPIEQMAQSAVAMASSTEAKLTAFIIGTLQGCLKHFAPEGISDAQIAVKAYEVICDAVNLVPDEEAAND